MTAMMIVTAIILSPAAVCADDTIRDADVVEASTGNMLVLYDGEFIYLSKEHILNAINELRREACKEGVPDPRDPSRSLTMGDYEEIRWSSDLEWIAQTRAAEGSMYMAHTRPNGERCFSVRHEGLSSTGEVLAWNSSADILYGIRQWYGEKSDWVNMTAGAVTGHYTQMIDPDNIYVGIGAFLPEEGYGTVAGEFSGYYGLDETQAAAIGKCRQIVEVQENRLSVSLDAPETIHIGREGKAAIDAFAEYTDGVWPVTSRVTPVGGVSWKSQDTGTATVDASGTIKSISAGSVTITGTAFGKPYTANVRIEDHIWNKNLTITKKATCTTAGSGYIGCSVCGEKKPGSVTSIAKTGHKWASGYTVDRKATYAKAGAKSIHCTKCQAVKTGSKVTIPKLKVKPTTISKVPAAKRGFTVKWNKRKNINGYQIQYALNKKFTKNKKSITIKKKATVSKKVTKLKAKKKYYVRIRTYKIVGGKKYYSKWSKVKTVTTKK